MATKTLTRAADYDQLKAGQWIPLNLAPTKGKADGRRNALVRCPDCGAWGTLENHSISEKGVITPSVKCAECAYHENGVTLEGWPG
jgi:hypothetical protein